MKRFSIVIAVLMVAVLCLAGLTACYPSKPAKLDKVVGTYELIDFTRTYSSVNAETGESESQVTDYIADKGVKAYLVVRADGTGYYVYQDNDTPLSARIVKITYSYDEEDPTLVESIVYDNGTASTGDGYPGKGREPLGVYFKGRTKVLSYSLPALSGKILKRAYSQSVKYSRVDNATDLSYVQKQLGKTLAVADYEVAGLSGVFYYQSPYTPEYPYVYYMIDLRAADKKADVYYMFKEDEVPQERRDLTVSFDVPADAQEYGEYYIKVTVGDDVLYAPYNSGKPATALCRLAEDNVITEWFDYYRAGVDIASLQQQGQSAYAEYKASVAEVE